ncbi:modular serine protease isoform X3 [Neodiprion lecontei]|uniref:Modular serine protease isoform X3 n=1 Tax=Neodiprion lecontei TaxID=441921 RepID=A0ABM3FP49_NEOLC|nr:modular serine protease isoform X3 [Neodiprion lecontei]
MRWGTCISVILVAAAIAETLCNDVVSDLPTETRKKRQFSLGSLTQTLGRPNRLSSNSDREYSRTTDRYTEDQPSGRQILGFQAQPVMNGLGGVSGIALDVQAGGFGVSTALGLGVQGPQRSEPNGPQSGEERPPSFQGRPGNNPPGLQGRPGNNPPGLQGRPGNNPPGNQGGRPPGRPDDRPGRPDDRPGRPDQGFGPQEGGPGERPEPYNERPEEPNGFQNGRPDQVEKLSGGVDSRGQGGQRPGQQNERPQSTQYDFENNRPITANNGNQNSRPTQNNAGRPAGSANDYQSSGNNVQPSNNQNRDEDEINSYNGVSTASQPLSNRGQGNKKCRGNQYTCQNRECVPRNARCNGINECQDGSDENNCQTGQSRPSQDSSSDYTTAAPITPTSGSTTGGCILPEQPTGGRYELDSCKRPCVPSTGSRVPLSSFLTYMCNEGYTLKGNNVSFCHNNEWYLPPTCVKTCSPLKSNSVDIICKLNGAIVSCESNISPGTKATLNCKHSYKLPLADDPVYRDLTCLEEGIWDRTLFRCLPECGTAVAHGNTLIVNGFKAKRGVFPWHVAIYQRNSPGSFMQICAGTLISPALVVSAAHCFYEDSINEVQDASNYAVAAGKYYRSYNAPETYVQKSMVKKIDVATRYYGASGNYAEDIALVHLETTFNLSTLVRPICMDWDNRYEREQLQNGKTGKAVGWGKTEAGVPSEELKEINLPFIPYQECVSAVPEEFKGYVTADKFCAGYLNGSSLCEGDSGGGLCFQLDGLWYLRGIVSVSPVSQNTCDNHYYTAFTNVGRFREWIRAAYIGVA